MLKLGIDSQPDLQPSGLADVQDVSEVRFATDSPLERDVFEPYVPQRIRSRFRDSRPISHHSFTVSRAGTESSNPSPSSGESGELYARGKAPGSALGIGRHRACGR